LNNCKLIETSPGVLLFFRAVKTVVSSFKEMGSLFQYKGGYMFNGSSA
jgi:hypothetical protein